MLDSENQQIISTGWFVGILEGEGSFRNLKSGNPEIRIANSNLDIIHSCEKYLTVNHIFFRTSTQHFKNGNKPEHVINIVDTNDSILKFAEILYNKIEAHLECRRDQFQQILRIPETTRHLSIDFDWLIGIFEGEGSLSLTKQPNRPPAIKIEIANTNILIANKIVLNLKSLDCGFYVSEKENGINQKRSIHIYINGMLRALKFLTVTKGKWLATRNIKRSNLILEYIDSRLLKEQRAPFTERELQIVQSMVDLNRKKI